MTILEHERAAVPRVAASQHADFVSMPRLSGREYRSDGVVGKDRAESRWPPYSTGLVRK